MPIKVLTTIEIQGCACVFVRERERESDGEIEKRAAHSWHT